MQRFIRPNVAHDQSGGVDHRQVVIEQIPARRSAGERSVDSAHQIRPLSVVIIQPRAFRVLLDDMTDRGRWRVIGVHRGIETGAAVRWRIESAIRTLPLTTLGGKNSGDELPPPRIVERFPDSKMAT